ncbi:MAG: hypothetical protein ACYSOZ_03705, partial [Planctomycetota bacterium]
MKTKNHLIALLIVILTAGTLRAEEKAAEEPSNTRRAEVELRITTDPKTFPMGTKDDEIGRLSNLMFRQDIAQAVWQEIIDTSDWDGFVEVVIEEPVEIGELQTVQVGLTVSLKESQRPAAKEFLEAYIKKLKSELQKENNFARDLYFNKHKDYAHRTHDSENHLQNLQQEQIELPERTLDKESVRQRLLEHERALIENGMQQEILRRRAEELIKQISESNSAADEITAIAVKIQQLQCDRAKSQA